MLSTKRLLTLKSMGKFKYVCKRQETCIFDDIQPVLQLMVACFEYSVSGHPCCLIYLSAAFSGWQVCKNVCVLWVKREQIPWLNRSDWLYMQMLSFSLCSVASFLFVFIHVFIQKCVFVCTGVCLFFHTLIFFQDKPVRAVPASQQ